MFQDLIKAVEAKLRATDANPSYDEILKEVSEGVYASLVANEVLHVGALNQNNERFLKNNYHRWKPGFYKLQMLKNIAVEAAITFQKQFLQHNDYVTDPLLGVLMRQHANACRITEEIIWLLRGGYADGALARWRTLFEISVTCLIINEHGQDAAVDYIKYGKIKSVEGMEEYQKTAEDMHVLPYAAEEVAAATKLKEELCGGDPHWHWVRKYTNVKRIDKLREKVGLGKWSHLYKLASKNIHADYYEMKSLFALSDAKEDALLVGPSVAGLVEPAHMTAITLGEITAAYLTGYINETTPLDYTDSAIYLHIIQRYIDAVGEEFMKCHQEATGK